MQKYNFTLTIKEVNNDKEVLCKSFEAQSAREAMQHFNKDIEVKLLSDSEKYSKHIAYDFIIN